MKKRALGLVICAVAAASVMAADSVELSVIGVVLPSAACMPVLAGNGVVDYGVIDLSDLSPNSYNPLPIHSVGFSITCGTPTKVAIQPQSLRPATSVAGGWGSEEVGGFIYSPIAIAGGDDQMTHAAGLNFDASGTPIGGLGINFRPNSTTIDGASLIDILEKSVDTGDIFKLKPNGKTLRGSTYAWALRGYVNPLAFLSLRTEIDVQAYVNKKEELDPSNEIELDGLVSFDLVYL